MSGVSRVDTPDMEINALMTKYRKTTLLPKKTALWKNSLPYFP